jgi:hypothetical protein
MIINIREVAFAESTFNTDRNTIEFAVRPQRAVVNDYAVHESHGEPVAA